MIAEFAVARRAAILAGDVAEHVATSEELFLSQVAVGTNAHCRRFGFSNSD